MLQATERTKVEADVVIVGASAAGCTAAILYANSGLKVVVVEKRKDIDFHKKMCTHYIQPCSKETWQDLGLEKEIYDAGGVKTTIAVSTQWGWIPPLNVNEDNAFNIRRRTLDPIMRKKTIAHKNVQPLMGFKVKDIIWDADTVAGVVATSANDQQYEISASLVVGADGRESEVSSMAKIKTQEWENKRFSCFAFFKTLPNESRPTSKMWLLDPYIAYQFPNDDNTTLIALMPTKDRINDFKKDREVNYRDIVNSLPDGPNIQGVEPITDLVLNTKNSLLLRKNSPKGMALVGDAFVTSDPLHGFGVSWAIMSARRLVAHTKDALLNEQEPNAGVVKFQKEHIKDIWGHFKIMIDMAQAKPMDVMQAALFSSATRDEKMAAMVQKFLGGRVPTAEFTSLKSILRAFWVNLNYMIKKNKLDYKVFSMPK